MKTSTLTVLMLILAFIGLADAWYLGDAALTGASVSCNIAILNGCNAVAASKYSHLLGIPLGVYGAAFYAAFFMLSALALVLHRRHVSTPLFFFGTIGALVSIILTLIQVVVLKSLCVYCLISELISFALFGISLVIFLRFRKSHLPPSPILPGSGAPFPPKVD